MPLILKDRVRETTTATGTGVVTLAGAVLGYQAFSVIGDGNTTYYCIAGQLTSQWEVGIGTYNLTGNTLTRNTILASSNNDLVVNFSSGIKDIFVTYPANVFSAVDIQEFTTVGTSTWTKPVGARYVEVLMYGGGGGGGAGRRRGAGSVAASSGSGGAPAARLELKLLASSLNATETVIVGAGGTGGAAQTVDATDGSPGANGGSSAFKTYYVSSGQGGLGGSSSSIAGTNFRNALEGTNPQGSIAFPSGASGSFSNPTGGGGVGALLPGGGGVGGGYQFGLTGDRTGSPGGKGGALFDNPPNAVTTGSGGAGGGPGVDGSPGADAPAGYWVGGGGGGGGGATSTQANAGGNGGYPGGGAGSGAAAGGAFNSGAGDDGGDGYVRVVTYL